MTLWESYLDKTELKSLQTNKKIDILIIGGGLAGLNSLYFLKDQNICLVEALKVGDGITEKTTGKLTFLQEDILYKLLKQDYRIAKKYLESQIEAIKLIKNIISKENINCDFENQSSLLITRKSQDFSKMQKIQKFLKLNNIVCKPEVNNSYFSLKVDNTYAFNPIKFLNHLKKILKEQIYERTKIIKIKRRKDFYECWTDQGYVIKAKKVIIACQYPFFLKPLFLPLISSCEKSYIIVKKEKENRHFNYITFSQPTFSFRYMVFI